MSAQVIHGDCLDVLRAMAENSVHSIVTDPPYGLGFMGKTWDHGVPSVEIWTECLRVLKPGGHLLAFAGTRTQHRMAVRIEDAGFEIRDMIAWVYGSGFPKSLDVSKAIDKAAGVEREIIGVVRRTGSSGDGATVHQEGGSKSGVSILSAPASAAAQEWEGWGTALKPALEPITVARKPFRGTVAGNVQAHGTGALNVDGCRIEGGSRSLIDPTQHSSTAGWNGAASSMGKGSKAVGETTQGRWPANFIHDGSPEVLAAFPDAPGQQTIVTGFEPSSKTSEIYGGFNGTRDAAVPRLDSGSAARFFYCAKASPADRHEGLPHPGQQFQQGSMLRDAEKVAKKGNHHPTVKPTDLMRYLCRLVTPRAGIVLDPFCGSGSTGKAALMEAFNFIGIEKEAEYVEIARMRIAATLPALLGAS